MVAMVAEPTRNEPTPTAHVPLADSIVPAPPVIPSGLATPGASGSRCKYRLRFRKRGDLRLVSHHDLMHVFERMLRRAVVPVAHSQGYHPQPRMVFALSLALGIAGANEVLELELTEPLSADHLLSRLASQAPPGLEIRSARRLDGKSSSLVRRAFYRLPLTLDWVDSGNASAALAGRGAISHALASLSGRCRLLLEEAHLWVDRSRPQPRRLNIRPYLNALEVVNGGLEMAVWVTPTGTARPEEYAWLLDLEPLLRSGAFFERTDLEMMDESAAPVPGIIADFEEKPNEEEATGPTPPWSPASKPAARPTALVSGPLSFNS
jgi:radical SAM-linked protein